MTYSFSLELADCLPVNHLWPELVDKLGVNRAQKAVRESLDLQLMHGSTFTLPVLLVETCGLALVRVDAVRAKTGFACHAPGMVLLLSTKDNMVQLLQDV